MYTREDWNKVIDQCKREELATILPIWADWLDEEARDYDASQAVRWAVLSGLIASWFCSNKCWWATDKHYRILDNPVSSNVIPHDLIMYMKTDDDAKKLSVTRFKRSDLWYDLISAWKQLKLENPKHPLFTLNLQS